MKLDILSSLASNPDLSKGRLFTETESPTRNLYQRDRDRIIHSTAFRRLEYKTQVFVNHEGDHYRTRLTHSLEVAQISRSIARSLGLHEDLAEAYALAHDLGHPPFGHAGEDALNRSMANFGGFNHNAQTLKILTLLEEKYIDFNGLNLTWETLEGITKHNGPLKGNNIPHYIVAFNQEWDLSLEYYPSLEAQIAAISDDIAYNNHDLDDGLRANLLTIDMLITLPFIGEIFKSLCDNNPYITRTQLIHEANRRIITAMVADVITTTKANCKKLAITHYQDIATAGQLIATFSPKMAKVNRDLKDFLFEHMYSHYKVNRMTHKAKKVVAELFTIFMEEPKCLPTRWRKKTEGQDQNTTAQIVCDFIAGMTDRFALKEHDKVFNSIQTK